MRNGKITPLTARQREVLDFLVSFLVENHRQPTSREIADHFGYVSQTAAINHLQTLERKGRIEIDDAGRRRICNLRLQATMEQSA